jgi:hypothetical protein
LLQLKTKLLAALCLAPATVALAGCQQPLTADECDALLDHYTELLVEKQNGRITNEQLAKVKSEVRAKASASRDFARCSAKVSRRQFTCAMAAPTVDDVERCLL